jgi:GntR family transcriptional regulator
MRGIQAGSFQPGDRLPGEIDLCRRFNVSRSTIRQALASLQHAGLIETWSGAGSFVCYNGARLDDRLGWSRALARHGVQVRARTLRFGRIEDVRLAETLALPAPTFLALDRVRYRMEKAISLERSRSPWQPSFASLLKDGLAESSLCRTLESLDIWPTGATEAADLIRLPPDDAAELQQPEGEPFLGTPRIGCDATGAVIEQMRGSLHSAHFTLQFSFGERQK